jgi:hypothetical protein
MKLNKRAKSGQSGQKAGKNSNMKQWGNNWANGAIGGAITENK